MTGAALMLWIRSQLASICARLVVHRTDDSKGFQRVQVQAGSSRVLNAERIQQYGFRSHAPDGCEGVVLFPMAAPDHPLVIAVDLRDRSGLPILAEGDCVLYTDKGQAIHLKASGEIVLRAGDGPGDSEVVIGKASITFRSKRFDFEQL